MFACVSYDACPYHSVHFSIYVSGHVVCNRAAKRSLIKPTKYSTLSFKVTIGRASVVSTSFTNVMQYTSSGNIGEAPSLSKIWLAIVLILSTRCTIIQTRSTHLSCCVCVYHYWYALGPQTPGPCAAHSQYQLPIWPMILS